MKRMLLTLRSALARRGLKLHPSKCKMQSNVEGQGAAKLQIEEGFEIDVVPAEVGFKLLGTMLHLTDTTRYEIHHRIASAWKLFWSMKRLLLNRRVSINKRLQLFDSSVCSCLLWCCESWTPRADELRVLKTARNSMLRRIVSSARGTDEDYVTWIRRATHKAANLASKAGVRDWVQSHYRCKWHWAGHVARRPPTAWVYQVTTWRDSNWQKLTAELNVARPLRPMRRRWMKWEDVLRRFCAVSTPTPWTEAAENRE